MTREAEEFIEKCETGCKTFTGGEKKHVPGCQFYPESMSKTLDELLEENRRLREALEKQDEDKRRPHW